MRAMLSRRLVLTAPLGLAAAPAAAQPHQAFQPTPRDSTDIARIEAYLNTLRTMRARFIQVAADGGITRGAAWLWRPGRLRFEYDPPSPFLLVAGDHGLVFRDKELRQTSRIPLSRTPLGILLAEHAKLSGDVAVTGVERLPGQIHLDLVRSASPGDGTLTLVFADNPLALRQWTVVDAQGRATRISLFEMSLGGTLDPKLFEFHEDAAVPGSSGG